MYGCMFSILLCGEAVLSEYLTEAILDMRSFFWLLFFLVFFFGKRNILIRKIQLCLKQKRVSYSMLKRDSKEALYSIILALELGFCATDEHRKKWDVQKCQRWPKITNCNRMNDFNAIKNIQIFSPDWNVWSMQLLERIIEVCESIVD